MKDHKEYETVEIEVLDSGHWYILPSLDGQYQQSLRFVKRCDLERPWRFPGNYDSYPGATLQMVIRALLDRMRYLQNQIWSFENWLIVGALRLSLWLLELRAARRHHRFYFKSLTFAERAPLCAKCGHTLCEHRNQ